MEIIITLLSLIAVLIVSCLNIRLKYKTKKELIARDEAHLDAIKEIANEVKKDQEEQKEAFDGVTQIATEQYALIVAILWLISTNQVDGKNPDEILKMAQKVIEENSK